MELSLFISDYYHENELRVLTQSDADKYFKRAIRFFKKAISEEFYQDELDESDPAYGVARDICENHESIRKIQFYLLSNALEEKGLKGLIQ